MPFFTEKFRNIKKLLTKLLTRSKFAGTIAFIPLFLFFSSLKAQDTIINITTDSIPAVSDTIKNDSINDLRKQISPDAISSKIDYQSDDSVRFNLDKNMAYLFGKAVIIYEDITLNSDYVEIDFNTNQLFAEGLPDSTGKENGRPEYIQGASSFTSKTISYNFDTKKGLVKDIFTNEGDSYLHGKIVKRFPDNTANFKNGSYTTCDLEHPHYQIRFGKARMIPDDKFVSGPAYMEIEGVPTPLVLPFGFFPNKKGRISGIIIPTWGESANRGFYFERGGYYWGINDYIDLTLQGDIYTRGSWAVYASSNYKKRYRYDGHIQVSYAENVISEKFLPDYNKYKDFSIEWMHKQDPKARPNSSFSAQVKAASNSFYKYNPSSTSDYLSNTFESSVAYQVSLFQGAANVSLNLGSKQNVQTRELQLWLPQVNFSVNTLYPFRRKKPAGALKWYENINISYNLNAQNFINTIDTALLTMATFDKMQNGIQHTIPIRSNIKILKHLNWTNAININERWYFQSIQKQWYNDTASSFIRSDTSKRFYAVHEFNYSSQLTTKIYGMYQFKKGALKAIRHVLTPTLGFVYHPDFGSKFWGYYRYAQVDSSGRMIRYSIFQNGIYGTPPDGLSAKLTLNLNNNLEMKVAS
ncbi:MAG: putative LPS assembly protein LptD, partial [Bacteroidales bacterium]